MKGIISEIASNIKVAEDKSWSLSLITVAGSKYSTFDLKDYDCKVGDLVEFDMKENNGRLGIVKGTLKVLEEGIGPEPEIVTVVNTRNAYDKDPVGLAVEYAVGFECTNEIAIKAVKEFQLAFKNE